MTHIQPGVSGFAFFKTVLFIAAAACSVCLNLSFFWQRLALLRGRPRRTEWGAACSKRPVSRHASQLQCGLTTEHRV